MSFNIGIRIAHLYSVFGLFDASFGWPGMGRPGEFVFCLQVA